MGVIKGFGYKLRETYKNKEIKLIMGLLSSVAASEVADLARDNFKVVW